MDNEQIIKVLEEFEKLENMKELDRYKYIDDLYTDYPCLSEQLKAFFNNKKVTRKVFYRELRKRLK